MLLTCPLLAVLYRAQLFGPNFGIMQSALEPSLATFVGCVTAELFEARAVIVKVNEVPQGLP